MGKLVWDAAGEKLFEVGVSQGVLYPITSGVYGEGVAWNGLTAVNESPEGGDETALYADNIKYASMRAAEEYKATIECYTYPDEFNACNGFATLGTGVTIGQQARQGFGFSYRSEIGNDTDGNSHGYKLHIIYGATCSPSEMNHETINDSPDAGTMSFELSANPVPVTGYKPTASLVIEYNPDSATSEHNTIDPTKLATIEAILYGADAFETTKTYNVGAVVTYQSATYRCTTKVATAGQWDSSKWTKVSDVVGPQILMPDDIAAIIGA